MSTDVPCLRHLAPLVTKTGEATPKVENGTSSQLNLPHGTKQKRVMKTLKKQKNEDAQKKRSSRKVRGVSPEAGRESMMGKK